MSGIAKRRARIARRMLLIAKARFRQIGASATGRSYYVPLKPRVGARMNVGRDGSVEWSVSDRRRKPKGYSTGERRVMGVRALRGVGEALQRDAKAHKPSSYFWFGTSNSRNKAYRRMAQQGARRAGYKFDAADFGGGGELQMLHRRVRKVRLYHGSDAKYAPAKMRPSRKGRMGPGYYATPNLRLAGGVFGRNVQTFRSRGKYVPHAKYNARLAEQGGVHSRARRSFKREGYVGIRGDAGDDSRVIWTRNAMLNHRSAQYKGGKRPSITLDGARGPKARRVRKSWTQRARQAVRMDRRRADRGLEPKLSPVARENLTFRLSGRAEWGNVQRGVRGRKKLLAGAGVARDRRRRTESPASDDARRYKSTLYAPPHIRALRQRLERFKHQRSITKADTVTDDIRKSARDLIVKAGIARARSARVKGHTVTLESARGQSYGMGTKKSPLRPMTFRLKLERGTTAHTYNMAHKESRARGKAHLQRVKSGKLLRGD